MIKEMTLEVLAPSDQYDKGGNAYDSPFYTDIIDAAFNKWNNIINYNGDGLRIGIDLKILEDANTLAYANIGSRHNSYNSYGYKKTRKGYVNLHIDYMRIPFVKQNIIPMIQECYILLHCMKLDML